MPIIATACIRQNSSAIHSEIKSSSQASLWANGITYSIAEKGIVGLAHVRQAGEYEAEETLRRQARHVLHEGHGVEGVGALGVRAHLRDDALGGRGGSRAEGEQESSCEHGSA